MYHLGLQVPLGPLGTFWTYLLELTRTYGIDMDSWYSSFIAQLFQAGATVCHCLTSFKVKIQLDNLCIGDGSYIDVHKFIWA